MSVVGEILFYRRDQAGLDDVLRHRMSKLAEAVDRIPESEFVSKSDDDIAGLIAANEHIAPLEVDFAAAVPAVEETTVEVNDRFGFDRGPVRIAGLKATKTIPFRGDPELWHLRTNPFNLNPPHGEVRGQNLTIGISVPAQQPDEAKRYIDGVVAQLPQYLEWQKAQLDAHNAALKANVFPAINQRRARLNTASDLLKRL